MNLLIGCPVLRRDWIIAEWYRYAVCAAEVADLDPIFILVGDQVRDPTFPALQAVMRHELVIVDEPEEDRSEDVRDWNHERFRRMVTLRNRLLERVRQLQPDYFLSLDSDILIHPDALSAMKSHTDRWSAVGGKTHMTHRGTNHPSYATLTRMMGLHRPDSDGVFAVDVIMAIKLMTRQAYSVDYEWARQGEDIGWSKACKAGGLKLGWVGTVTSKHVMRPEDLYVVDPRCGY